MIEIDEGMITEKKIFGDLKVPEFIEGIKKIALAYDITKDKEQEPGKPIPLRYFLKERDRAPALEILMPSQPELSKETNGIRTQLSWRGWLRSYKGSILIDHERIKGPLTLPVEIPDPRWAFFWGLLVFLLSFVVVWAIKPTPLRRSMEFDKNESLDNWRKSSRIRRLFLYPLNFAITPIGTYSISIIQVLLWSYITIFGIVYVHWLTGRFIDITDQVLMLLGIGGGTTLAAKINAVSRAHENYRRRDQAKSNWHQKQCTLPSIFNLKVQKGRHNAPKSNENGSNQYLKNGQVSSF